MTTPQSHPAPDTWIQQVASEEVITRPMPGCVSGATTIRPWDLRWRWDTLKPQLQKQLLQGSLVFEPVHIIQVAGEQRTLWPASAALILKALTIVLTERLSTHLSDRVYHVAGAGGAKAAVRHIDENAADATLLTISRSLRLNRSIT